MPLAGDVNLDEMAAACDGFSGAETALICREAGLKALSADNRIEQMKTDEDMKAFKIDRIFVEKALEEVKARGKKEEPKKTLF